MARRWREVSQGVVTFIAKSRTGAEQRQNATLALDEWASLEKKAREASFDTIPPMWSKWERLSMTCVLGLLVRSATARVRTAASVCWLGDIHPHGPITNL